MVSWTLLGGLRRFNAPRKLLFLFRIECQQSLYTSSAVQEQVLDILWPVGLIKSDEPNYMFMSGVSWFSISLLGMGIGTSGYYVHEHNRRFSGMTGWTHYYFTCFNRSLEPPGTVQLFIIQSKVFHLIYINEYICKTSPLTIFLPCCLGAHNVSYCGLHKRLVLAHWLCFILFWRLLHWY